MIQLYTWATPNGKKVSIMLEEVGLPYEVRPVNLSKGEQMKPNIPRSTRITKYRASSIATVPVASPSSYSNLARS